MLHRTPWLRLFLLITCLAPLTAGADLRSDMYQWQAKFKATAQERAQGAVLLQKRSTLTVADDATSTYRVQFIIAVLDDQAATDYSRFRSGFNSYFEDMRLVAAHLLNPDGEFRDAAADAIQIKTADQALRFDDTRYLSFALPAVKPGSIVAYEIESNQTRTTIPGQWYNRASFVKFQDVGNGFRIDPTRESSFTLVTKAGTPVRHRVTNADVTPRTSSADGRTRMTWTMTDIPAIGQEDSMPSMNSQIPTLAVSSLSDWAQVDAWAAGVYLGRAEPDAALRRTAKGLIKPGMSQLEKTKAVFYYVQRNIRYIGADLDRGGYTPHHAREVLANAYGDCKDQAVILIAMLRALGIEAYPALIGGFHESLPLDDVPTLFFSHMIVHVPGIAGGLWLDTSGDAGSFPSIAWQLEGRKSFVIDGRGGRMLTLPLSSAQDNRVEAQIAYSYEGQDILARIHIDLYGAFGHTFKLMHKQDPQHEQTIKRIAANFHDTAPLRSLQIEPALHDDRPYAFTAVAVIPDGYADSKRELLNYGGNLAALTSVFTGLAQIQNQASRATDYHMGFPYTLRMRRSIAQPDAAYRPIIPTRTRSASNPWFDFALRVDEGPQQIQTESRFTTKVAAVPQAQYGRFRDAYAATLRDSGWNAGYKRDEYYQQQQQLEARIAGSDSDVKTLLELANHHLMMADYGQARALANQAIAHQPDSGEAHYVLGISLGFMDEFDASEVALRKARELGYTR